MKHVLVVSGGEANIDFIRDYIRTLSFDKVFAVDKGLEVLYKLDIVPDIIIGDFDSADSSILEIYDRKISSKLLDTVKLSHPVMKDESDTELAIDKAVSDGAQKITIIGATGKRLDHALANIGILIKLAADNIECEIIDEYNRIRLIDSDYGINEMIIEADEQFGKYISLIPIKECIKNVTLSGVLYPLDNADVKWGSSLTVSNQITNKAARIFVGDGAALLIESRDSM